MTDGSTAIRDIEYERPTPSFSIKRVLENVNVATLEHNSSLVFAVS